MIFLDEAGAATPFQAVYTPSAELSDVVSFSWIHRVDETRRAGKRALRIVPDDSCHLMLQMRERAGTQVPTLVGPRSGFVDAPLRGRAATVGVRLRPGTVRGLFGVAPAEIRNKSVRLSDLPLQKHHWDPGDDTPVAALEEFLRLLSSRTSAVVTDGRLVRLRRMTRMPRSDLRVSSMASEIGMSERQLREISNQRLGLSPASFIRIRRLFAALGNRMCQGWSWTRVAAESGYHDQSHMIKDFRALLGETPVEFEFRRTAS